MLVVTKFNEKWFFHNELIKILKLYLFNDSPTHSIFSSYTTTTNLFLSPNKIKLPNHFKTTPLDFPHKHHLLIRSQRRAPMKNPRRSHFPPSRSPSSINALTRALALVGPLVVAATKEINGRRTRYHDCPSALSLASCPVGKWRCGILDPPPSRHTGHSCTRLYLLLCARNWFRVPGTLRRASCIANVRARTYKQHCSVWDWAKKWDWDTLVGL